MLRNYARGMRRKCTQRRGPEVAQEVRGGKRVLAVLGKGWKWEKGHLEGLSFGLELVFELILETGVR